MIMFMLTIIKWYKVYQYYFTVVKYQCRLSRQVQREQGSMTRNWEKVHCIAKKPSRHLVSMIQHSYIQ